MFALAALIFTLFFIGAGIVITIVLGLILAAFAAVGIISASVLVGLHKKSVEKGFRVFWLLTSTAGGIFLGSVLFYFLNKILHWYSSFIAILSGAISGFLGGIIIGIISFLIFKKLIIFIKGKFNSAIS